MTCDLSFLTFSLRTELKEYINFYIGLDENPEDIARTFCVFIALA